MSRHNKKNSKKKARVKSDNKFHAISGQIAIRWEPVILAAGFFIIMTIVSFSYHKIGDYGVETDFYWSYVPEARSFLNGSVYISPFRGPVYPVALAAASLIIQDIFHAGILLAILSASLVLYFSYRIFMTLYDRRMALWGTMLIMVNPVFIQYSYSAGTDMFFNALVTGVLYLYAGFRKSIPFVILTAFISAVAYLTRYNGVFLVLVIPFCLLILNHDRLETKKRILLSLLFLAVFALTILPWGLYCLQEKGQFLYNNNYRNIAYELYGKGKISWDAFWSQQQSGVNSFGDVILKDPGLFIRNVAANTGIHFFQDMKQLMGLQTGIFVIAGIISLFFSRPDRKKWTLFVFHIAFFSVLLVVFYSNRFSLFLIMVYVLLALTPLLDKNNVVYQKFRFSGLTLLIPVVLVLWTGIRSYAFNSRTIQSGPREILTISEWYQKNVPDEEKGDIVSARKPHIAYYMDLTFQRIPYVGSVNEMIRSLRKDSVDYLFFSGIEASTRPDMRHLLNPKQAPPDLIPLVYTRRPPAVLYRLREQD